MFDFITDPIENSLDITVSFSSGEDISKRQVAQLLSDGLSIVDISEATGVAVNVLEGLMDD